MAILEAIADREQAAQGMAHQDHRPAPFVCPLHVVMDLVMEPIPVVDVDTRATGPTMTDHVEGADVEPRFREKIARSLVPTRVLGHPVNQDDDGTRLPRRHPLPDQFRPDLIVRLSSRHRPHIREPNAVGTKCGPYSVSFGPEGRRTAQTASESQDTDLWKGGFASRAETHLPRISTSTDSAEVGGGET